MMAAGYRDVAGRVREDDRGVIAEEGVIFGQHAVAVRGLDVIGGGDVAGGDPVERLLGW